MINGRDDWLSPAGFVAGIDLEDKPAVVLRSSYRRLTFQEASEHWANAKIGTQLRIKMPSDAEIKAKYTRDWMA